MKKVQGLCSFADLLAQVMSSHPIALGPSGVPSQRKRSPEGETQGHPPTKTARCAFIDSGRIVEATSVPSSAPLMSGGAVVSERNSPICEGELCSRVSSPQ